MSSFKNRSVSVVVAAAASPLRLFLLLASERKLADLIKAVTNTCRWCAPVDHFQGILFVRSDHQGNRDRKRSLGVWATVQLSKSLHVLAILAHPSLAFDLVTHRDLAD